MSSHKRKQDQDFRFVKHRRYEVAHSSTDNLSRDSQSRGEQDSQHERFDQRHDWEGMESRNRGIPRKKKIKRNPIWSSRDNAGVSESFKHWSTDTTVIPSTFPQSSSHTQNDSREMNLPFEEDQAGIRVVDARHKGTFTGNFDRKDDTKNSITSPPFSQQQRFDERYDWKGMESRDIRPPDRRGIRRCNIWPSTDDDGVSEPFKHWSTDRSVIPSTLPRAKYKGTFRGDPKYSQKSDRKNRMTSSPSIATCSSYNQTSPSYHQASLNKDISFRQTPKQTYVPYIAHCSKKGREVLKRHTNTNRYYFLHSPPKRIPTGDNTMQRIFGIRDFDNFNVKYLDEFKTLLKSKEKISNENLQRVMSILDHVFVEPNADLCEALMEGDFFERHDLMAFVSELLIRCELSNSDETFMQHSSQVLIALSSETNTKAHKLKAFLNLIIALANKANKQEMKSTLSEISALINMKEKRENLEADEKGQIVFSESMKKELSTLIKFEILPTHAMIRDNIIPILLPRMLRSAPKSQAHYLVEQFYLFLEDFIGPLRRGLRNYMAYVSTSDKKTNGRFTDESIRLYEGIRILEWKCVPDSGIVIEIQFDVIGFKRVQWDFCNYLQYGNVVCLTHGDCETLVYALITERKPQSLRKGKISLSLVEQCSQTIEEFRSVANGQIVMLESKAFYTAYRHTLESMKSIARKMLLKDKDAGIPFSKHIVELKTDVLEPLYSIEKNGEVKLVNFECLVQSTEYSTDKDYWRVSLLNTNEWPSAEVVGMDEQQYLALKMCLTKKLGILQGPPGTGKTWMGLRIVEFMLNNNLGYEDGENKPILLLSYTNHALDQVFDALFDMDSLMKLFSSTKNPFVRVGSRSNIERIQRCTLIEHRKQRKSSRSSFYWRELMKLKQSLFEKELWLKKIKNSIVSPTFLFEEGCVSESQRSSLQYRQCLYNGTDEVGIIFQWLEIDENKYFNELTLTTKRTDCSKEERWTLDEHDEGLFKAHLVNRIVEDTENLNFDKEKSLKQVLLNLLIAEELLLPRDKANLHPCWQWYGLKERESILKYVSRRLRLDATMSQDEVQDVEDVWCLSIDHRWRIYKSWIQKFQDHLESDRNTLMEQFREVHTKYKNQKTVENINIVSNCSLVGMTTTGAAQNMDLLRKIQPRIVIVEEAAQVFEQHILGCLTNDLQHLILIGDHQQLQPAVNNYQLMKSHKTNVSLMERLVMNNLPFVCLSQQHRMRPEISSLLTPTIYKNLKDHSSVLSYEHVQGIQHDVFFLNHTNQESQSEYSTSHRNEFEAQMIARLCRYLLLQRYSKNDITILSAYNDQVKVIRNYMKDLENDLSVTRDDANQRISITAVDNFQGEENKIVLLSLVRGNAEKKIGHLHDIKRICVSLSRAKQGFYVIGNFDTIRKSKTWNEIISKAEGLGLYGDYIPLHCVNHPETITKVFKPADFDLVPVGGCIEPCGYQLECGHTCDLKCHADATYHDIPCKKLCTKIVCDKGHKCDKECSHPRLCGPCEVVVTKIYTKCNHQVQVGCSISLETYHCRESCSKVYPCDHICQQDCGIPCQPDQCSIPLPVIHPRCGHEIEVPCCLRSKLQKVKCTQKCESVLPCGHACKGDCYACSSGRLHVVCEELCQRVLVCGHSCNNKHPCSTACPPCNKPCMSGCSHLGKRGCRRRCGEKCIECREPCIWSCDEHCKNGYHCTNQCFEECDRPACNRRCNKDLPCKHRCVGICGEPCPTLCRRCDKNKLTDIFFGDEDDPYALYIQLVDCNHVFEVKGFDKYMNMEVQRNKESVSESCAIKLIRCPLCQTPIRQSRRYKNTILQNLKDINAVKTSMENERSCSGSKGVDEIKRTQLIEGLIFDDDVHFLNRFSNIRFTNKTAEKFHKFFVPKVKEKIKTAQKEPSEISEIKEQSLILVNWLLRHKDSMFTEYEVHQFSEEVDRFFLFVDFVLLLDVIDLKKPSQITGDDRTRVTQQVEDLRWPTPRQLEIEEMLHLKETLRALQEKLPLSGLGISEDEKRMILKAFSFKKKGHWYKCKNGK